MAAPAANAKITMRAVWAAGMPSQRMHTASIAPGGGAFDFLDELSDLSPGRAMAHARTQVLTHSEGSVRRSRYSQPHLRLFLDSLSQGFSIEKRSGVTPRPHPPSQLSPPCAILRITAYIVHTNYQHFIYSHSHEGACDGATPHDTGSIQYTTKRTQESGDNEKPEALTAGRRERNGNAQHCRWMLNVG